MHTFLRVQEVNIADALHVCPGALAILKHSFTFDADVLILSFHNELFEGVRADVCGTFCLISGNNRSSKWEQSNPAIEKHHKATRYKFETNFMLLQALKAC